MPIKEFPLYYVQWNLSKADTIGTTKLSLIERVSSGQGFIIHYVGYIWDSASVYYQEGVLWRGVSAKRGSTVPRYKSSSVSVI